MNIELFYLELFFGVSLLVLLISLIILLRMSKQAKPKKGTRDSLEVMNSKKETHISI